MKKTLCAICLFAMICGLISCGPMTSTIVQLNRESYTPKVKPSEFANLQGKRILFASIDDKSTNTKNLCYYNPEKTVGYSLYYSSSDSSLAQPVVSFFWYALKKGFEQAGVIIVEDGPLYDAELYMTITSLTDEEMRFNVLITKKGSELYRKSYEVRVPGEKTQDTAVLQERAYLMLDAIVRTILADAEMPLSGQARAAQN